MPRSVRHRLSSGLSRLLRSPGGAITRGTGGGTDPSRLRRNPAGIGGECGRGGVSHGRRSSNDLLIARGLFLRRSFGTVPAPVGSLAKIAAQETAYGQQTPRIGRRAGWHDRSVPHAARRPNGLREDRASSAAAPRDRAWSAWQSKRKSQRQRRQTSHQSCLRPADGTNQNVIRQSFRTSCAHGRGIRRPGDRTRDLPARPPLA